MKKTVSSSKNRKTKNDSPSNDAIIIVKQLQELSVKIDKASLSKYIISAFAIFYSLRRSNALGNLAVALFTGSVTKLLATKLEEDLAFIQAPPNSK